MAPAFRAARVTPPGVGAAIRPEGTDNMLKDTPTVPARRTVTGVASGATRRGEPMARADAIFSA